MAYNENKFELLQGIGSKNSEDVMSQSEAWCLDSNDVHSQEVWPLGGKKKVIEHNCILSILYYTDYRIIKYYSLEQTAELETYSFSPTSSPTNVSPVRHLSGTQLSKNVQKYWPGPPCIFTEKEMRSYEVK